MELKTTNQLNLLGDNDHPNELHRSTDGNIIRWCNTTLHFSAQNPTQTQ